MSVGLAAGADHTSVVLARHNCLHSLSSFAECQSCQDICPAGAIKPSKPPVLDVNSCTGCLACVVACPTGAYEARDGFFQLVSDAAHYAGKTLELACEKPGQLEVGLAHTAAVIQVPGCLASVGAGAYLALSELGIAGVVVRCDRCSACEWGSLLARICNQLRAAAALSSVSSMKISLVTPPEMNPRGFQRWTVDEMLHVVRPILAARGRKLTRREAFRIVTYQDKPPLLNDLESELVPAGRRLGQDRKRIRHLLNRQPAADRDEALPQELGFAGLHVSERCTACGACVRVCPTGALSQQLLSDGASGRFQLSFDSLLCIGCGLCASVCLTNALSLAHPRGIRDVLAQRNVVLIDAALGRCARCNVLFASHAGSTFCPTCGMRKKSPFSYRIPV